MLYMYAWGMNYSKIRFISKSYIRFIIDIYLYLCCESQLSNDASNIDLFREHFLKSVNYHTFRVEKNAFLINFVQISFIST